LAGGLINPQVSGLVQQLFRGHERGRAFGMLGTTVGIGTALGPLVGGALIALGGQHQGWRLVFFVNIPIGIVVILLARLLLQPIGRSAGTARRTWSRLTRRRDLLHAFCRRAVTTRCTTGVLRGLAFRRSSCSRCSPGASAGSPGYGRIHSSTYACSARPPKPLAYCSR